MDPNLTRATGEPPCPPSERLSDYLDGELTGTDRRAVERHLEACAGCRQTLAVLRDVVARARALAPLAPPRDLWSGIEARLLQLEAPRARRLAFTFSMPQLAAAAVLLVALTAGVLLTLQNRGAPESPSGTAAVRVDRRPPTTLPVSFADEAYDRAIADLERALQEGRGRLDPQTVAVVERNLAAIDAAIAQARAALESDPSNTYLNTHLADARKRKLALLQRVSAIASPEG